MFGFLGFWMFGGLEVWRFGAATTDNYMKTFTKQVKNHMPHVSVLQTSKNPKIQTSKNPNNHTSKHPKNQHLEIPNIQKTKHPRTIIFPSNGGPGTFWAAGGGTGGRKQTSDCRFEIQRSQYPKVPLSRNITRYQYLKV